MRELSGASFIRALITFGRLHPNDLSTLYTITLGVRMQLQIREDTNLQGIANSIDLFQK